MVYEPIIIPYEPNIPYTNNYSLKKQWSPQAGENRFAPELNEKEIIELLEDF